MKDREKMLEKLSAGREYRWIEIRALELKQGENEEWIVEGYATTFNQPYELYRYGGYVVLEQVDPAAFEGCDMSDVIMQYDHQGHVFARTRNKTLTLIVDAHGLRIRANLGGTELGRQLYEEIKGGYIDRMSIGFRVGEDRREETEDHTTNTVTVLRTITRFDKLFDVSAVSIPANDATEISARSYVDGVIEQLKAQERREAEKRLRRAQVQEEIRQLLRK